MTVEGCLCVAELLSAAGEKSRLRSKPLNECNGLFTAVMRSCRVAYGEIWNAVPQSPAQPEPVPPSCQAPRFPFGMLTMRYQK